MVIIASLSRFLHTISNGKLVLLTFLATLATYYALIMKTMALMQKTGQSSLDVHVAGWTLSDAHQIFSRFEGPEDFKALAELYGFYDVVFPLAFFSFSALALSYFYPPPPKSAAAAATTTNNQRRSAAAGSRSSSNRRLRLSAFASKLNVLALLGLPADLLEGYSIRMLASPQYFPLTDSNKDAAEWWAQVGSMATVVKNYISFMCVFMVLLGAVGTVYHRFVLSKYKKQQSE